MNEEDNVRPCHTGEECPKSGIWHCQDHPAIYKGYTKGEVFPNCWQAGSHRAIWEFEG